MKSPPQIILFVEINHYTWKNHRKWFYSYKIAITHEKTFANDSIRTLFVSIREIFLPSVPRSTGYNAAYLKRSIPLYVRRTLASNDDIWMPKERFRSSTWRRTSSFSVEMSDTEILACTFTTTVQPRRKANCHANVSGCTVNLCREYVERVFPENSSARLTCAWNFPLFLSIPLLKHVGSTRITVNGPPDHFPWPVGRVTIPGS